MRASSVVKCRFTHPVADARDPHHLGRGTRRSTVQPERAIRRYIEVGNEDPEPCIWTESADDILDAIKRYRERTLAAHAGQLSGIRDQGECKVSRSAVGAGSHGANWRAGACS